MAPGVYRCEKCQLLVSPKTRAHKLVVETRPVKYPYRSKANRVVRLSENGKPRETFVDDRGGEGREIAKELTICPACAAKHTD